MSVNKYNQEKKNRIYPADTSLGVTSGGSFESLVTASWSPASSSYTTSCFAGFEVQAREENIELAIGVHNIRISIDNRSGILLFKYTVLTFRSPVIRHEGLVRFDLWTKITD